MFTKSIVPGDWVKLRCGTWYIVEETEDNHFWRGWPINNKGETTVTPDDAHSSVNRFVDTVERIGDRPLKSCHAYKCYSPSNPPPCDSCTDYRNDRPLEPPPLNCSNPWIDTSRDAHYHQVICAVCGNTWGELRA